MAKYAGLDPGLTQFFIPFLVLPLFLLKLGPLVVLLSFLAVLRLPHVVFWWFLKEKRKRVKHELPLVISEISCKLHHLPLFEVLKGLKGETGRVYSDACRGYAEGKSIETALKLSEISPEIIELNKRLLAVQRSGEGFNLLDLYAKKVTSENLAYQRVGASRMQLFAVCYTALSAILPAMYSGLSIYSKNSSIFPFSIISSIGLVILWRYLY